MNNQSCLRISAKDKTRVRASGSPRGHVALSEDGTSGYSGNVFGGRVIKDAIRGNSIPGLLVVSVSE